MACGTTGESATLTHEEHDRVVALVIEQVNGRIPVIAGSGSNSTAEAVQRTQFAMRAGADGALLVAPYYNKPTQEGLYQHFRAIAESADIPIVLYNVPGRTVVQIGTRYGGTPLGDSQYRGDQGGDREFSELLRHHISRAG